MAGFQYHHESHAILSLLIVDSLNVPLSTNISSTLDEDFTAHIVGLGNVTLAILQ
jgi:hypothetical protein